jgi:hypothetical protein
MTTKKAQTRSGRPVNVYLGEPDITRLRTLGAFLMTQGHRVSDSQVIKSALIVTKPSPAFLRAFQEVLDADLRYRKP